MWASHKKYNISASLIRVIKHLCEKATSAIFFNGRDWFRTTVRVRQEYLLSPTLFNMFQERITTDASEGHESVVSIGGRIVTKIRFADDTDGLAGEEEELSKLAERLDRASAFYGIEVSAEKTKLMINGQKLETATSFK